MQNYQQDKVFPVPSFYKWWWDSQHLQYGETNPYSLRFVSVDTQRVLALLCVASQCHTDMEEPALDMEN